MYISNFAINHRTTVLVLVVLIVFIGMTSYRTLPREAAPDIQIPFISVMSRYEGASPSDMESLVTRPLERKLKTLTEMKQMTSTSSEENSMIFLEFEPDTNIDFALQKVRDKVDEAKGDLPADMDDPTISEISAADIFPVMFIMVSGEVGLTRLKEIAEALEDEVEAVRGVLEAQVLGAPEREIRVEFDPDRLTAYGLTLAEVVLTVSRNNIDTPGGSLDIGEAKYNLKVPSQFTSPEEVDLLVVSVRNGKPVYLSDVARINDTYKDRLSISRINGRESVALRVTKRQGENLLDIARNIKTILEDHRERLPAAITLTVTSDTSKHIEMMVADLENNMVTGLLLVLTVIFLSLGLRNALLVSVAIPISMLIAFFVLQALGITLNMVVLFSLILALGMLVDNGVVIVENIYRHHTAEGKPVVRAAMEGTQEVAWPVIASTFTTVVAFLPLAFWPGIMGQFMGYLPKTVILALLSSLFVALVITPTLCAVFLKASKKFRTQGPDPEKFGIIVRTYGHLLRFALRYRVLSFVLFFGMLALAIWSFAASGLGVEMFPDTEPSRIMVDITAPEGTNLDQTDNFARQAEEVILKYGNIEFVTTAIGAGSGGESGSNAARIMIDMVDREFRRESGPDEKIYFQNSNDTLTALRRELTAAIVGAEIKVDKEAQGPPVGAPVNVEIAGDDYETLARIADTLKARIADIKGIVDLTDDYVAGLPEIKIVVDKQRAALLGLDAFLIGQMVKASLSGIKVATYREAEDEYDIVARLPLEQRRHLQDILRLRVPAPDGSQVPLSSVASVVQGSGLSSIKHIDQKRIVTVSSQVATGFNTQQVLAQVRERADAMTLPAGYSIRYTGENEEFEESQAFMTKAFVIACLLILLVLVTQFDSLVQPGIILTSVVLSFIGVFSGLMLTRTSFGVIMTGMGVISLAGVVVNNAIVLLDYINQLRTRGLRVREAIVRAGCTRFRPVMLTAITTILSLTPMATGISFNFSKWRWEIGSESSQWWGPMAVAVIFGLMFATLLTLFVVPNAYSLAYETILPGADRLLRRWGLRRDDSVHSDRSAAPPDIEVAARERRDLPDVSTQPITSNAPHSRFQPYDDSPPQTNAPVESTPEPA